MKNFGAFLITCVWFALLAPARAAQPMDQIHSTAEHILGILRDPAQAGDAHRSERQRLIGVELDRSFDWKALARGCLGRQWLKRTPAEQQEFADVFGRLLKRTYIDLFDTHFAELDKVDYQSQRIIENYASVKVLLITKDKVEHPVEFRLEKSAAGGDWRAYDVLIEGVSLVKNYRDQFDEILAKSSYPKLLQDLRSKVEAGGG